MISRRLRLFVFAIDAAAAATLLAIVWLAPEPGPGPSMLLLGAAAVVAGFPVRLPSLRVNATSVHPFVFAALVIAGPLPAVLIDITGVLVWIFGRRQMPRPIHLAFNLGAVIVSTAAAWTAYALFGGVLGATAIEAAPPLVAAALAYFLVNAGLVATAVAMESRTAVVVALRNSCLWTAMPFFAGVTVAVALVALAPVLIPWGILLALPPCWAIITIYRSHAGSPVPQRGRRGAREVATARGAASPGESAHDSPEAA